MTYTVRENPVVQSIRITASTPSGQPSVPAADLMAQMKTKVGKVLNTNSLVSDLDSLFNHTNGYVTKQGYLFNVSSDINIEPKTGVLTIPLIEAYVKSVEVTGNSRVKTADILAQMHTKPGVPYNISILEEDKSSIYEMGEFKQVDASLNAADTGKLSVTVSVVEQPAATGVLDEKQGKVIPSLYNPLTSPFPVVQVSVNGKPPLSFILDTGTTAALSLNPWAVQKLGLKTDGPVKQGIEYTYQMAPIHSVVLLGANHKEVAFNIQSAQIVDSGFMGYAFSGSQHIAGLVGLGLLAPYTARLDFAAQTLTVFAEPHPPLLIPGGTVLPLRADTDNEVFTVRTTLAPDTYANLILDTGSMSTQVPFSALKVLHPTAMAFHSFYERIEGLYLCPDLRLAGLTIGTLKVPDVTVGTLPSTRTSLGMDILSNYRLTLDSPNAQLILEPSAHSRHSVTGHSGLDIKPSGDSWKVSLLENKLPAQASGLQIGNEIITVNGASVKGLTRLQIGRQLSGLVGVPIQVSARRGNKVLALTWVPVDEFSASHSAVDGLSMTKAPNSPWVIVDVMKDSLADRAGLLARDKITRIDTEAVADMPPIRSSELFGNPSILVEVERSGLAKPFTVRLTAPK